MKEAPVMANQMLSVGRTIWDWAIPLGLAVVNPFDKVKDFDIPDRMCPGRRGWSIMSERTPGPTWCAWSGLAYDGRDLIRMCPGHRDHNGLWCRPKKTSKRRRAFHIPLAAADALELDRCAETPVTFTNSRWLKPIKRFREDLYLYSPKGAQYTAVGLRAGWQRAGPDVGHPVHNRRHSKSGRGRSSCR
jgi:hypothetical protein